jgi:hypothetical protein
LSVVVFDGLDGVKEGVYRENFFVHFYKVISNFLCKYNRKNCCMLTDHSFKSL